MEKEKLRKAIYDIIARGALEGFDVTTQKVLDVVLPIIQDEHMGTLKLSDCKRNTKGYIEKLKRVVRSLPENRK